LALVMPVDTGSAPANIADATKMAAAATLVGTTVYVANIILSFWLPEPQQDQLPD
jgi:hypothetical protein